MGSSRGCPDAAQGGRADSNARRARVVTERERLLRRIAILDNVLKGLPTETGGDHGELKRVVENMRADGVRRLNDLGDDEPVTPV
jgi:hypothetical protein